MSLSHNVTGGQFQRHGPATVNDRSSAVYLKSNNMLINSS